MQLQITLMSNGGIVQIEYKAAIVEGIGVNEMFASFLINGDHGLPVSLRPGDNILINAIPNDVIA